MDTLSLIRASLNERLGVQPDTVVREAALASLGVDSLQLLELNFEPGFFVEHFIKDMGIALDEAKRMNLALPGLALANQLYLAVQAQGWGRKGTHALMLALEQLSGIKR